ncbi:ATP-dependent RNA helicase DBP1, partial [Trichoplax sp. H2]
PSFIQIAILESLKMSDSDDNWFKSATDVRRDSQSKPTRAHSSDEEDQFSRKSFTDRKDSRRQSSDDGFDFGGKNSFDRRDRYDKNKDDGDSFGNRKWLKPRDQDRGYSDKRSHASNGYDRRRDFDDRNSRDKRRDSEGDRSGRDFSDRSSRDKRRDDDRNNDRSRRFDNNDRVRNDRDKAILEFDDGSDDFWGGDDKIRDKPKGRFDECDRAIADRNSRDDDDDDDMFNGNADRRNNDRYRNRGDGDSNSDSGERNRRSSDSKLGSFPPNPKGIGRGIRRDDDDGDRPPPVNYIPPPPSGDLEKIFAPITVGVDFDKYGDLPVKVVNSRSPEIVDSFDEMGENLDFPPALMKNITRAHYKKPTPVQQYGIPIACETKDLIACAQTGSGKTAAFILPIINSLLHANSRSHGRLSALILAPTRELASQSFMEAYKFCYETPLKPIAVYGGTNVRNSRDEMNNCDIVVATFGRLIHCLERNWVNLNFCLLLCFSGLQYNRSLLDMLKLSLRDVKFLVVDEADRMLDEGNFKEFQRIVTDFDLPAIGERQTMMYSATFSKTMIDIASEFTSDNAYICVGDTEKVMSNITQNVIQVRSLDDKKDELLNLLRDEDLGKCLVFLECKMDVNNIVADLKDQGFKVEAFHGDKSQEHREHVLRNFKKGAIQIMVASAAAERGLDIPNIKHVVIFDMPRKIGNYVHRIGRTGRLGAKGYVTVFFNPSRNREIASDFAQLLRDADQEVPRWLEGDDRSSRFGRHGGRDGNGDFNSGRGGQRFDSRNSRGGGRERGRGFGNGGSSRGFGNGSSSRGFGNGGSSRGFGNGGSSRGFGNGGGSRGFRGRDSGRFDRGGSRNFGNYSNNSQRKDRDNIWDR